MVLNVVLNSISSLKIPNLGATLRAKFIRDFNPLDGKNDATTLNNDSIQ